MNRWHRLVGAVLAAAFVVGAVACSSPDGGDVTSTSVDPTSATVDGSGTTAAAGHPALYAAACDGDLAVGPAVDLPDELVEISGIAPSSERPDVVWAIGDGGSAAAVHAVDLDGNIVTTVAVEGVENNDWEDLAAGPAIDGSGATWLYVADIGDNSSERERIRIQAFEEPPLSATDAVPLSIIASYSTGATDAEALAVTDDGFWIVGKEWGGGGTAPLYHLAFDEISPGGSDPAPVLFEPSGVEVATGGDLVTAMDAAPDAGVFAVRTYRRVQLFDQTTADLTAVATTTPCDTQPIVESQGESVAVLADGRSLVTASEGGFDRPAQLHVTTIG